MEGFKQISELTELDRFYLNFIAQGLTYDQIANEIGFSRHTVKLRVSILQSKFSWPKTCNRLVLLALFAKGVLDGAV